MNFSQECLSKKLYGYCIGYHTIFLNLNKFNTKTEQVLLKEIQNYKFSIEKIYKPWQLEFWKDKWASECPERGSLKAIQPNYNQVFLIENEDSFLNNSDGVIDSTNVKLMNYSADSPELSSTAQNNTQQIVLKDWRLVLSKTSQLFIIGTIDGLQITWSERIVKILGSFKLLTPNNIIVLLAGPLVDPTDSMPTYIKNKFLNGFKSDWLDEINLWLDYEKRGRPNSFIWNKNEPQTDFCSPIIIHVSEPNPSLSTSVNFSDFNEISILNDTVKMDDDESELIIETNLKNEPSLSSIATEPSDSSFSSIDIILISKWTPYFNHKLKIIGIEGTVVNHKGKTTQIRKVISKMITNLHFRSTDGYLCKLAGGLYDPLNKIPEVVKKLFQKNLLTHLSKIIKTWSTLAPINTSGVNISVIDNNKTPITGNNKSPITGNKKESSTTPKRKPKEMKLPKIKIAPKRSRNSKDTVIKNRRSEVKKTPNILKGPVKRKISLKGRKKDLNSETEIMDIPLAMGLKRVKKEETFSPEV